MIMYKERPLCRRRIEEYLKAGITLEELLDVKVIFLTDGMKCQVKKMLQERGKND